MCYIRDIGLNKGNYYRVLYVSRHIPRKIWIGYQLGIVVSSGRQDCKVCGMICPDQLLSYAINHITQYKVP